MQLRRARPLPALSVLIAAIVFTSAVTPDAAGAIPRSTGMLPDNLFAPPNVTSALPSCGACHDRAPNANGRITMHIAAAARSFAAGARVRADVSVTGGPKRTPTLGGFTIEADRGAFVISTNTKVSGNRAATGHADKFGNKWQFDYDAPTTPGLVQWTGVAQAVNANNSSAGDSWGFWGPDSAKPGVPYRLFANHPAITAFGAGCAGTDGHEPILGAATQLAIGTKFVTELHNVPGGALAFCAIGASDKKFGSLALPFDLGPLGAPTCFVRVDHLLVQQKPTTGAGSGGGSAIFDWPLPNNPSMRGAVFFFQGYALDRGANAAGLTASNAIKATVQ